MQYLIDFIVGFTKGGLFIMIVVFVLFTIANVVFGDESVAVRKATLGEQDRSLNYKYMDSGEVEHEHTVTIVIESRSDTNDALDCAETNARLQIAKDYANKHVKANPKHKYIYAEVLELIEEKWCHDND